MPHNTLGAILCRELVTKSARKHQRIQFSVVADIFSCHCIGREEYLTYRRRHLPSLPQSGVAVKRKRQDNGPKLHDLYERG